ncbi:GEVED domain-containing protein [Flavobacterium sedimenticola]|uniref:GEVED domain-containing protein n=1 Tax=Flavobacterium sedimenticola TaxID=3043286 RepID=A0ABT6XNR4_9FLAO|nr:GEVED domain-containing protein [Flavobacterium sedimenticola]MDI9256668.1 GEVED domain-containing protein [Flavobacterium sedimenticola]
MINNYTNLSTRSGTWLNKQKREVVGQSPNLTWCFGKSSILCVLLLSFFVSFGHNYSGGNNDKDKNTTVAGSVAVTTCPNAIALSAASLPITNQALVCGTGNDLSSTTVPTTCGGASNSYKGGNESLYTLTPTTTGLYNIAIAGQTWTAIFVYQGCPTSGGTCVGSVGSSASSKNINVTLTAGLQYYIWFDTWPTPNSPCPGTFSITPPPTPCSGVPNAGVATISTTTGCAGNTVALSATGLTFGLGVTYNWQSSPDNSTWTDISGATTASYNATTTTGTTYYRIRTTCSTGPDTNFSNVLTFTGVSCGSINIPASGNNTVACGTNTSIYDNGGPSGSYVASSNGYTVLENSGTGVITISGSFTYIETSWDFLRIYSGVGTGGTLLYTYSNTAGGVITPFSSAPGQPLTIQFTSDTSGQGGGFALQALYSGTCATCTGTPDPGTAVVSSSSGCAGGSVILSATGLTTGPGFTYQWQSSPNNSTWTNIPTATTASYTATTVAGTTYYRIVTSCPTSGTSNNSNVVSVTAAACGSVNLPSNGNSTTVDCGTSTFIYDNGGPSGDYTTSTNSFVVLDNSGTGVITISGSITGIESCCDYLRIYSGAGTGGTLLASANAIGAIPTVVSAPGEVLTVQFFSDISIVGSGFALQALYSGTCLTCTTPVGGTASAATAAFCNSGSTTISATGQATGTGTRYQWESSTDNFASVVTPIGSASSSYTNLATGTLTATTSYRLKVFCVSNPADVAYSTVATVTINFPGTINPVAGDAICPGESATLTATASEPATFAWTAPGGYSNSGASISVSPTTNTVYTVTATFANNCTASTTTTVTVAPAININSVTSSVATLCGSGSATLTADVSAGSALTYCESVHNSGCSGDDVTNVTLGAINNNTSGCGGSARYTYFNPSTPTTTTTLSPGSNTITVSFGTDGSQYFGAWIDYNQDGSLDASEFLGASGNAGSNGTISVTFTVPTTAFNGVTRLRLVAGNDSPVTASQACGVSSSGWGETQDYNVTISGATNAYTFAWTEDPVGSTLTSTTSNPTSASGITTDKVYTVTVTSAYGCSDSDNVSIDVDPLPVVTLASNVSICKGSSTTITIPETGNSYAWSPAGGLDTTSGATVVANPTVTSTYSVLITNNSTFCQNTQQITVNVSDPGAIVTQPVNAVTSTGFNASFTVAGTAGVTYGYQWQRRLTVSPETWTNLTDDYVAPSTGNYTGTNTATLNVFRAGSAPALTNTVYRCILTPPSPCANLVSNNATLTVGTTGIVSNPQSLSICLPAPTSPLPQFNVVTSGSTPNTLVWSVSTNGGVSYVNMPMYNISTNAYTGPNTTAVPGLTFEHPVDSSNPSLRDYKTLTVSGINGATPNNLRFRVTINTFVVSQPAILTLANPVAITNDLSTTPVKVCYAPTAAPTTFTVSTSGSVGTVVWKYATSASGPYTDVALGTPAGVSYVTAAASNNYSLTVNTTAGVTPLGTYYYKAFVGSAGSCPTVESNAGAIEVSRPTITASASSASYCTPGPAVTLTAGGSDIGNYSWSTSQTGATIGVTPSSATTYTVTGTDSNGCSNTAQVTVGVGGAFTAAANSNTNTVCPGAPVLLTGAATTLNPSYGGLVGAYTFSTSTGAALDNMSGATTLVGTSNDDTPVAGVAIPFPFNFNGVNYTFFSASPDGFIRLANTNAAATSQFSNSVTSTTNIPKIYPLWDDLATGTDGWVKTVTRGTAPNRIVVIEWRVTVPRNTTGAANSNFQAWLYEGSNKIEFRYGSIGTTGSASAGLTGSGTQYQSITYSTNTSSNSTSNNSLTTPPASGRMYTFLPPVIDTNTYTYAWTSTPAGFTASGASVTASPSVNTTYNLTITSQSGCTAQATKAISVDSAPPVIGTQPAALQQVCQGTTVTISVAATSATPLTYQWFKDGSPVANGSGISGATTNTLTITGSTPANSGNYTVNVTNCSTVTSSTAALTVYPTPTVVAPAAQAYCIDATIPSIPLVGTPSGVTFDISGGAALGLANQTGVTAIPSFVPTASGTATITVTPKANGCTGTAVTYSLTINALPAAPVLTSTPVCEGSTLNLNASVAPLTGYTLNSNSGVSFIDINATGTSVGTLEDDSEHNITIPAFTFNGVSYTTARIGNNGVIVFGSSSGEITFSNTSLPTTSVAAGNAFLAPYWDDLDVQTGATCKTQTVGNIHIIQFTTMAHDAFTTGSITFQVQLNLTTGVINFVYPDVIFGSSTYDSGVNATIGIQYSSSAALQYSSNTASLVNGQSLTFTPQAYSYAWTGPGFTSAVQNPSIANATPANSGAYTLQITNPNGCKSSATVNATVYPTPTAVAPANQLYYNGLATAAIPLSGTPSGVTYDISGGAAVGLANATGITTIPSFIPVTGSATVSITPKANGCTGATVTYNIVVTAVNANPIANQVYCEGVTTAAIPLSSTPATVVGATITYNLNVVGDDIGLYSATGLTEIPSFVTKPGSATITVYPVYGGVFGGAVSATITVNPLPTATISGTTQVCRNDASPLITFTGANGTAPYTFTYTLNGGANQTIVSLGNVATISVPTSSAGTYTYTLVSVQDSSSTTCSQAQGGFASVIVYPTPTAVAPANQLYYSGFATAPIPLSGTPTGVTFNISGGAAAGLPDMTGITTIPSFIPTTTPATVTITPVANGCIGAPVSYQISFRPVIVNISSNVCGSINNGLNNQINCTQVSVPGFTTTGYQFEVTNTDTGEVSIVQSSQHHFKLTDAANYAYGTTFTIRVAAILNGNVQGYFGTTCSLTTASVATTKVVTAQCGATLLFINSTINANSVGSTNLYRFRVALATAPTTYYYVERTVPNFKLTDVAGLPLLYDTEYKVDVQIRVKLAGFEAWSQYGQRCSVFTPSAPETSLVTSQCEDYQVPSYTTTINAIAFPGATKYRFRLVGYDEFGDVNYDQYVDSTTPSFTLSMFTGLTPSTTYTVSVAMELFGSFTAYGKDCSIITPSIARQVDPSMVIEFKATAYPNPFAANFMLNVRTSSSSVITIKVYDMVGRLVEARSVTVAELENATIGDRYPSGVYNVVVSQDETVETVRVVKR